MTAVERLARELCGISASAAYGRDGHYLRDGFVNKNWQYFAREAEVLLTELQAPQWALIEKWRRESEELRGTGNKFYLNKDEMNGAYYYAEADKLEARIKELEQALGESDDR